jgi:hypothetical protein
MEALSQGFLEGSGRGNMEAGRPRLVSLLPEVVWFLLVVSLRGIAQNSSIKQEEISMANEMMNFDEAKVYTGVPVPQQNGMLQQVQTPSALTSVDQARAVAEVQAAMVVARMNPRDEMRAYQRIVMACKRKSLAEQASYAYPRGGKMVTGPSIRLAEVIAGYWGNITYGLRELNRGKGISEVEAFAWDLETNTRVTRQFQVKHIRDKSDGGKQLTGERDIYELVASMGQRRVRACILEVVPGDIVEGAEEECKKTLQGGNGEPMEDRIRKMVLAFSEFGISKDMIEARLRHKIEATLPAELVTLQQIYRSLKDGMAKREEFFDMSTGSRSGSAPEEKQEEKKQSRGKKSDPAPQSFDDLCSKKGMSDIDKETFLAFCLTGKDRSDQTVAEAAANFDALYADYQSAGKE